MTVPRVRAVRRGIRDARLSASLNHGFSPARTGSVTIQATEVDCKISPPADKLQHHSASDCAIDERIRELNPYSMLTKIRIIWNPR